MVGLYSLVGWRSHPFMVVFSYCYWDFVLDGNGIWFVGLLSDDCSFYGIFRPDFLFAPGIQGFGWVTSF